MYSLVQVLADAHLVAAAAQAVELSAQLITVYSMQQYPASWRMQFL